MNKEIEKNMKKTKVYFQKGREGCRNGTIESLCFLRIHYNVCYEFNSIIILR